MARVTSPGTAGALRVEVAVVGAGPGGCAAAITCAAAGLRVALVDKSRFPRDKCCGDGLTTGALRRLERLGLSLDAVPSFRRVDELAARSPSGRIVRVPLAPKGGRGVAAGVARRRDLDDALLHRARAAGASVLEGRALAALDEGEPGARGARPLRLVLADGTRVEAPAVIAADGAWSPTRRLAGSLGGAAAPAPRNAEWHAFRTYMTQVDGPAQAALWVWFAPAWLPGYAWAFPLADGLVNVGLCVERREDRRGRELQQAWNEALESTFLTSLLGRRATPTGAGRSWPIPAGVRQLPLHAADGRILFVGDAARAADPFTGEGVAQALESGIAAAEAVVGVGGAHAGAAAAHYEHAIASALAIDHDIAWRARALMSTPLGARAALRGTDLTAGLRRGVGRWLYEDYPRALLRQPWRWRPALTARPSPFRGASAGAPLRAQLSSPPCR